MRKSAIVAAVLLSVVTSVPYASAAILTTTGPGDGYISRDWYSNPNSYWVDSTSPTINAYHAGSSGDRWWHRGLVIIDISSLSGSTLQSTSFNFFSLGFNSGVKLEYSSNPGPVVTTSHGQISGTLIADLGGTSGWTSYDVTALVQNSIDLGHTTAGFVVRSAVNEVGGNLASFEDGQGRAAFLDVSVPEPATLSLLALGGMAVLRRRKR